MIVSTLHLQEFKKKTDTELLRAANDKLEKSKIHSFGGFIRHSLTL